MAPTDIRARLTDAFAWRGDRADVSGWWADPQLLSDLGPALADLYRDETPTVVVGTEALGFLLGAITAIALGVGFVEIRKDLTQDGTQDAVLRRTTPPDYNARSMVLGVRSRCLGPGHRALFVDEWMATGGQAVATRRLVEDCGARWVGAAVVVDATDHIARRNISVRGLLRLENLSNR